jgi:hypothetical protein
VAAAEEEEEGAMMIMITPIMMIKDTAKSITMMTCDNHFRGRVDLTKAAQLVTLITTTPFMRTKGTPFMRTKRAAIADINSATVKVGRNLHLLPAIDVWVRQFGLIFTQTV